MIHRPFCEYPLCCFHLCFASVVTASVLLLSSLSFFRKIVGIPSAPGAGFSFELIYCFIFVTFCYFNFCKGILTKLIKYPVIYAFFYYFILLNTDILKNDHPAWYFGVIFMFFLHFNRSDLTYVPCNFHVMRIVISNSAHALYPFSSFSLCSFL